MVTDLWNTNRFFWFHKDGTCVGCSRGSNWQQVYSTYDQETIKHFPSGTYHPVAKELLNWEM